MLEKRGRRLRIRVQIVLYPVLLISLVITCIIPFTGSSFNLTNLPLKQNHAPLKIGSEFDEGNSTISENFCRPYNYITLAPSSADLFGYGLIGEHAASMQKSMPYSGAQQSSSPPSAVYDEQLGMSFTQNFDSMAYNVTAVEQADVDGNGPGYLLNGLSNTGYWYQVGLSWHWPNLGGGNSPEFNMNYEVFDPTGRSIFPDTGGGGLAHFYSANSVFYRTVNRGDNLLLKLNFSNGNVEMYAYDWNTSAFAIVTYSAEGASYFVGQTSNYIGSHGFFTGLMTEWWHAEPYYGDEANVTYRETNFAKSSAWMWADEFVSSNKTVLFSKHQFLTYSNPTQLQFFRTNGSVEASNAYDFYTGSYNQVPFSLSYSVFGGGMKFTAPRLTFWSFGKHLTVSLNTSQTEFYFDSGTAWSVDNPLQGSSSQELWISNQPTNGIAGSPLNTDFNYYHQFLITFNYNVVRGSGYSPPTVTVMQYGASLTVPTGKAVYSDAFSKYSYENPLKGSSSNERWAAPSTAAGTVLNNTSILLTYYDQLNLTLSYSIAGDGSGYSPPTITFTQYGSTYSNPLSSTATTYWFDVNTSWSVPDTLAGSGQTERWYTIPATSEMENVSIAITQTYYHQFLTTYIYGVVGGGNPPPPVLASESSGMMLKLTFLTSQSFQWLDYGAAYLYQYLLGNSSTERWISDQTMSSGKVSAPLKLNPSFQHQYYIEMRQNAISGGFTSPSSGWQDAGQQIKISATPNNGWLFEYWNGSGADSYSGNNSPAMIPVDSPITEYATFYPGLTLKATYFGSISYSYTSNSGTIDGGTSRVVYFPLNSTVLLAADSWPYFFKFNGWSDEINQIPTTLNTVVSSPKTIRANFGPDWINIGIAIIIIVAAAAIMITLVKKKVRSSYKEML